MTALAIATLAAWFYFLFATVRGGGTARGLMVLAAPVLSIALAIAELA